MTESNPSWQIFQRWLRALPPRLGAVVDALLLAVLLALVPPRVPLSPLGRQVPLYLLVLVPFASASYGLRHRAHRGELRNPSSSPPSHGGPT